MFNDDTEDETVILDQRNLISPTNDISRLTSLDLNQFNTIESTHDPNDLSREKTILLAITFTSFGMIIGLLGPIFPFLAENLSTESHSIIRLVTIKAFGFLVATCFSSYLYTWFNVCCLLGLSCLSISFGVCSLAFITDLTAFYLTSLLLGIGLGLSYNGIDLLYNRLWTRSSTLTIRWLHLFLAFGAILSTLMLLPSTISTNTNISLTTNMLKDSQRLRRANTNETTLTLNASSTVVKIVTKPAVVALDILSGSLYTKPPDAKEKARCIKSSCCYDRNNTLVCRESEKNQSNICKNVFSLCQIFDSKICYSDKNNHTWCQIDQKCANETKLNCSIELTNLIINENMMKPSTIPIISKTNMTSMIPRTKAHIQVIYRHKPPTADSANDDLSQNFFYLKIRSFIQTITYTHILHLFLTCIFFLLGISYSILAMRGENLNSSSITNVNSLGLICLKPYSIISNSNTRISILSDLSSLIFIILILLFYFILSGFENLCIYLTYSFGIEFNLTEKESLILQICYLSGRFIDLLINYMWLLLDKYKKKSLTIIPIRFHILLRLMVLFTISFLNLFHSKIYLLFFSMGFLLMSLASLLLTWIERDLDLNEIFLRLILFTILLSEMIFPMLLLDKIQYLVEFYLFIGLGLLISLFLMILYVSRKRQRNRMYRLVSTSMTTDEIECQENSDNERLKDTKLQ